MFFYLVVCHLLGDYLESIKKDFEKASKVYRSNCDDYGYSRSCLKYGNYTFLGKGKSGTKGSAAEAFKYYERGCDLKDADSCLHSGLILVSRSMSTEVKRDVAKVSKGCSILNLQASHLNYFCYQGVDFLKKACEMNNATACFYLSGLHISGVDTSAEAAKPPGHTPAVTTTTTASGTFVIEKDMKKAFGFAYKACELKNMYACANLSQMYARGEGTEKNEYNAEKYRKLAVEMQDELKKPQAQLGFQQGLAS